MARKRLTLGLAQMPNHLIEVSLSLFLPRSLSFFPVSQFLSRFLRQTRGAGQTKTWPKASKKKQAEIEENFSEGEKEKQKHRLYI